MVQAVAHLSDTQQVNRSDPSAMCWTEAVLNIQGI